MAELAIVLSVTFAAGLVMTLVRLPALLGFLAAGFLLNAVGVRELPYLDAIADLGVTLMLFGIGLKLDLRSLFSREVWVVSVGHMALSVAVGTSILWLLGLASAPLLAGADLQTLALIAFALSFSSTVFVVKVLDQHADMQSFYGRVAIGVLVVQDLAAVVFLSMSGGKTPSVWAIPMLALLLPLAWLARRLWSRIPHGEMQALFGLTMALGAGYAAFELVGLKGDLGALVVGALLSGHRAASELSRTLFSLKDLLLVGFFLSIGFVGVPTLESVGLGLLLVLILPLQVVLYLVVLDLHRLRRKTTVKAALLLGNYSEFGLIVVSVAVSAFALDESWLVAMSVAVAVSFVLAAIGNEQVDRVLALVRRVMAKRPPEKLLPDERPLSLGDSNAVVVGMGQIGRAAYAYLGEEQGMQVVGVENYPKRVDELRVGGYNVLQADATDDDFWMRLERTGHVEIVVLAMPFHGGNGLALAELRAIGYEGVIATIVQYSDEVEAMREAGADVVVHLFAGAGTTLAERAVEASATSR